MNREPSRTVCTRRPEAATTAQIISRKSRPPRNPGRLKSPGLQAKPEPLVFPLMPRPAPALLAPRTFAQVADPLASGPDDQRRRGLPRDVTGGLSNERARSA